MQGEALVRLPHQMVMFVGQAWLAEGADATVTPDHEHDEFAWWPREIDEWPPEAGETLPRMARWLSGASEHVPRDGSPRRTAAVHAPEVDLVHPLLHLHWRCCLSAFVIGKPEPLTFVLGLTHGLLWIFMSLACIAAARLRIVSLRLAVAVAVLGGIGPFFGSYEFIREQRTRERMRKAHRR